MEIPGQSGMDSNFTFGGTFGIITSAGTVVGALLDGGAPSASPCSP